MRSAISPRLAMRILRNTIRRPPPARATSSMTTSSWPYSTASPGSTRLEPTTPSAGATTSWAIPSMSTLPRRSPARTRVPWRASERGWKMPDGRRRRHDPAAVRACMAVAAVPSLASGSDRRHPAAGQGGVAAAGATPAVRGSAVAAAPRRAAQRSRSPDGAGGPARRPRGPRARPARWRRASRSGRAGARRQAIDRGVVGGRARRRCAGGPARVRLARVGHALHLLPSGWLVARPRRDRAAHHPSSRIEQVAQAIRRDPDPPAAATPGSSTSV